MAENKEIEAGLNRLSLAIEKFGIGLTTGILFLGVALTTGIERLGMLVLAGLLFFAILKMFSSK
jgi:hypothetical protein